MSFVPPVSHLQRLARARTPWIVLLALFAAAPLSAQGTDNALAARTKGSKSAPVTVYEMADFQCPVCGRFVRENFPTIEKEYIATGKVRWIYINFPLTSIHANAAAAAEFATCAAKQDKFWPTHDMLYRTQESWEKLKNPAPFFESQIPALGLRKDAMAACLQSGAGMAIVRDDAAGSEKSGAHSTPSFYIEGGFMEGLWPIDVFKHVLDSVYAARKK